MPLPLWLPLLALAGALASDAEDEPPRWGQGEPLDKSIFDVVDEMPMLQQLARPLSDYLSMHPVPSYRAASVWLERQGLGDPSSAQFAHVGVLLYALARAQEHRAIWKLEDEAYTALANTAPPWELVRNRLPRMPFPAMLIRLPEGQSLPIQVTQEAPRPGFVPESVDVRSILLIEEIPGEKLRYIGFNDAPKVEQMTYSKGYLDLNFASAKAQLVEGVSPDGDYTYAESGDDQVWKLVLNLLLALDNQHLDGQRIKPKKPKSNRKAAKAARRKSFDEYTVVRLSQSSRAEQDAERKTVRTPTGRAPQRRHLRAGHWRSFWMADPGDKPIYGVKGRIGHDGRPLEGNLYKVVKWVFPYWAGEGQTAPGGRFLVKP